MWGSRGAEGKQSPERLNLIGELNSPEGTLKVCSIQASEEGRGRVQVAPYQGTSQTAQHGGLFLLLYIFDIFISFI